MYSALIPHGAAHVDLLENACLPPEYLVLVLAFWKTSFVFLNSQMASSVISRPPCTKATGTFSVTNGLPPHTMTQRGVVGET